MKRALRAAALAVAFVLAGCATGYQERNITGGFEERQVRDGIWYVTFAGNGYTTRETVQTFWLYRCSEIALQQGFDGFEIVTNMKLAGLPSGEGAAPIVPVQMMMVEKPAIAGMIRLIKAPVKANPPHVFDAHKLKEKLEPLVKSKSCGSNVCPHFHGYLLPDI